MPTSAEQEQRRRAERARRVALFRYELIQDACDPALSVKQRGRLVRELAAAEHTGPFGNPVRVSRGTIDRWIRWWRTGGFEALVPTPARVQPRTPSEVLATAAALKRENPERTATQVARILRAQSGWAPSERTLQRHFVRCELDRQAPGAPQVFGRFEAERVNELWTGDALHGPRIGGTKTYLFAFLDDHSRVVVGHRFGYAEDTVRLAAALRPALASRGVPESIYVDNGSAFVDSWLLRACARLGIKLTHSTPGRPQGRGKIERFFRTVREQFLVEVDADEIANLAELNRLFTAWIETVYHTAVHSETGMAPLTRWNQEAPEPLPRPSASGLHEAFLWSEYRTVTKTATVSLLGNTYQVDPVLTGRKVELVFDPFDLSRVEARHQGHSFGPAAAFSIGRHSHPKARSETSQSESVAPTGINYLHLIDAVHNGQLGERINFHALAGQDPEDTAPAEHAGRHDDNQPSTPTEQDRT